MVDVMIEKVSVLNKRVNSYPTSEASLFAKVKTAIAKRKTFEVLTYLERKNRITKYLSFYLNYQAHNLSQLKEILEKQKDNLALFELLVVVHKIHSVSDGKVFDFQKYFRVTDAVVPELPKPTVSDDKWLVDVLENIRTATSTMSLVDFAETIMITKGKYKGRLFRHDRAPYGKQIHKWLSEEDPCQELVNMWGVQIGKSTAIENAIMYYMKVVPTEILAVLGSGDAAESFSKDRIEPRAAQLGIKFIAEDFGDSKKRATGNKILSKEFAGGSFDATTAGSPTGLASKTIRALFKDELDRWPIRGVGAEGNADVVADARTHAWGDRKKIASVSSPNLVSTSLIYKKYLIGTQHHFHINCPRCDNPYPLEMGVGKNSGLTYETKAGRIDKDFIYYQCPHCREVWFDNEKLGSMQNGIWVPHATALKPNYISTQLSSLYSPFHSWMQVCMDHKAQVDDPSLEQTFVNMTLGLPYEPKGSRPNVEKLITLRDQTYSSKTVPEGVLYLTAACDVQRGAKSVENRKKNPPRLEVEVLGHCNNWVTKSIEYLVIYGETDVQGEGAWKKLDEMLSGDKFKYYRRRDGFEYEPAIWLFDSGDGERTDTVYQHCRSWGDRVFPIKGASVIRRSETDGTEEDRVSTQDYIRFKKRRIAEDLTVYNISTNHYKKRTYHNVNTTIARAGETEDFSGKCYFPKDYPDNYFSMLTAEEMKPDGTFVNVKGRRNEALDIRVYNLAGADIWIDMFIESLKSRAKATGQTDLKYIDFNFASEILSKKTNQL